MSGNMREYVRQQGAECNVASLVNILISMDIPLSKKEKEAILNSYGRKAISTVMLFQYINNSNIDAVKAVSAVWSSEYFLKEKFGKNWLDEAYNRIENGNAGLIVRSSQNHVVAYVGEEVDGEKKIRCVNSLYPNQKMYVNKEIVKRLLDNSKSGKDSIFVYKKNVIDENKNNNDNYVKVNENNNELVNKNLKKDKDLDNILGIDEVWVDEFDDIHINKGGKEYNVPDLLRNARIYMSKKGVQLLDLNKPEILSVPELKVLKEIGVDRIDIFNGVVRVYKKEKSSSGVNTYVNIIDMLRKSAKKKN